MAFSLATGLFLSALVVALAFRGQALSASGAAAALVVGTVVFGLGGWVWGVLLFLFFASSSMLSYYRPPRKRWAAGQSAKGPQRDAAQVLANGGLGGVLALCSALAPAPFWFPGFVGVMATVTADTWATELGPLDPSAPRRITSGRRVAIGSSGAISALGTAAAGIGSLLIGVTTGLLTGAGPFRMAVIGTSAGLLGAMTDSLLGAKAQRIHCCPTCRQETERSIHPCGSPTYHARGWAWLTNDGVNALASLMGGATAMILARAW